MELVAVLSVARLEQVVLGKVNGVVRSSAVSAVAANLSLIAYEVCACAEVTSASASTLLRPRFCLAKVACVVAYVLEAVLDFFQILCYCFLSNTTMCGSRMTALSGLPLMEIKRIGGVFFYSNNIV